MAASTFVAFDPKPTRLGTVINFIAASAIQKGHVVGFAASGTDWTVAPATGGTAATGITPIGVALYSQPTAGGKVAVACFGSVVKVMNGTDGTSIDAGTHLVASSTAGMVEANPGTDAIELGIALQGDAVGSGLLYMLVTGPIYVPTGT
jgi:hypothetical protein